MAQSAISMLILMIQVRINGRGNAWPIVLGQDHPFYDRTNIQDLANASASIIKSNIHPLEYIKSDDYERQKDTIREELVFKLTDMIKKDNYNIKL